MPVSQIISFSATVPTTGETPAIFNANAIGCWNELKLNVVPDLDVAFLQMNELEANVNAKEVSAVSASAAAVAAANFKGTWVNQLTSIPESWEYNGVIYGVLVAGTASPVTTPSNWFALTIAQAIKNIPSGGITATTVQGALNELDIKKGSSYRNRIINGDMAINQIYGSTAVTPTGGCYISDQMYYTSGTPSKLTFQQVIDAPTGFKFSTKITVAAQYAPLATDSFQFVQFIEGQMITDFAFGTSGAVTLNTSNWIKGSVAGVYSVMVGNGSLSYVGTINVTTSWTKVSITIPGSTTGTWTTDIYLDMYWRLDLGSGTNFNTTAGAWQAGDFTRTVGSVTFVNQVAGSTLNITGVQLEKVPTGATTGTDFEFLPADISMMRCQRYLPSIQVDANDFAIGQCTSATTAIVPIRFHVPARVKPTGVLGGISLNLSLANSTLQGATAYSFINASKDVARLNISVASGLVAGNATILNATTTQTIIFTGSQL